MPFYSRKNPRASWFDYSSEWLFFVTICTKDHECYFGKIENNKMLFSEIGKICEEELQKMLSIRPNIELFNYVIMPNHVHLLLCKGDDNLFLWDIIAWFKAWVTRHCHQENITFWWQNRYHDVIVRDEKGYIAMNNYISTNIENWGKDKFYKIWEGI